MKSEITVKSIRGMAADAIRSGGCCKISSGSLLEIARKLELLADRNVSGLAIQKEWQQRAEKVEAELAALAAQEPVAWQFKASNGKWLDLYDEYAKDLAISEGCEVRPLFTRAAPAGVAAPKEDVIELWHAAHIMVMSCRGEFSEIPTVAPDVADFEALRLAVQKLRDAVIEANKKAGE